MENHVTLFEYIAIAFSMVLSLTVLRALSVIPHAVQAEKRYWVYLIWLVTALVGILLVFWTFWWFRDVEWNIGSFLLVLASPAVLYVYVAILVPENAADVSSWREYFYSVRVRLFLTAIVWDIVAIFGAGAIVPIERIEVFLGLTLLLVNVIGAVSNRPLVHAVLVLIPPALTSVAAWLIYFQPTQ